MYNINNKILELSNEFGLTLTEDRIFKFNQYYNLLISWNEKMNLTAITDIEGIVKKHFIDSMSIAKYFSIDNQAKLLDIGTGAGFPGIPLKIIREDLKITLLESLTKRAVFLRELCDELGIEAEIINERAEDAAHKVCFRQKFDYVVSRAVAKLNVMCEYVLPFLKVGGYFIAMKGPNVEEEANASLNALKVIGGDLMDTVSFDLFGNCRTLVIIRKDKETSDKYPRSFSKIKSCPL